MKLQIMNKILILHTVLIILEVIARIHDVAVFGAGLFAYYTIDSNILQMFISAISIKYIKNQRTIPAWLATLHLICAVSLTITFLIALLVLAPQEGFAYYFISNVAPINHFFGPLISVVTFVFMKDFEESGKTAIFSPMAATLLYGAVALILNGFRIIDGPYFFLKVYETSPDIIVMWFCIIAVLCVLLSGVYLRLRRQVSLV